MNGTFLPRLGLMGAAAMAMALSGCLSSSNGGGGAGGTGPVTPADYDTSLNRVQQLGPTGNMPTRLQATYSGATKQNVIDNGTGNTVGEMLADLELTADWTDGQTTNPWSGTADNFRGTVNGQALAITGELTVAEAEANSLSGTIGRSQNTIPLPGGGSQTVATGAMTVNLAGTVDDNGTDRDFVMNLGGGFFGDQGQAITGTASTQEWVNGRPNAGPNSGAGTFYVEQ